MDALQLAWSSVYHVFGGDHFMLTIVLSNIVPGLVFWFMCLVFTYADVTGKPKWMLKHKVQEDKNIPVDRDRLMHAMRVAIFNQVCVAVPFSLAIFPLQTWMGCSTSLTLPPLAVILRDIIVCVLVEEVGFYYSHRLVHWGPLYRAVHKKHHEWTASISLVAIYCHPLEMVTSNLLPIALGPILMGSHLVTQLLWVSVAIFSTVTVHSGYHLPLLPSPQFHDYHHLKFNTNYGVLGFLDWLHGTDKLFRDKVESERHTFLLSIRPMKEVIPAKKI